ncbi:GP63-like protein leishmanolysin-like protein [Leishmania donovani]|uniref:Leishmanolysin n=1 Tax=Leishmania donovani TaxID=5661 RepID=A0A6J8FHQ1_LEIDO|nr:GP63-like protein leishmanolysin-like protein [Leishmania donovani]VDZ47245.1 GP63-like_protein_leishmanolysin-like_protein/GeneDB:LmjF.31.2000 [Leishmania donovani]
MSHVPAVLWRMELWLNALFIYAAFTTVAAPSSCGHSQVVQEQGHLPLTYAALRNNGNGLRYQVEMGLERWNGSATAEQRAVEPQATVTISSGREDSEWAPIRIAVFMPDLEDESKYCTAVGQMRPDSSGSLVPCTSNADLLTDAKKAVLINSILPQAVNMHAQRLKVRRLAASTSIVVNSMPGSYCGSFTVPTAHRTTGVPNADFVVYVAAGPTSTPKSFIAWAVTCQYYPNTATITSRPAVGAMYFNPRYLPTSVGETQEHIDRYGGNPSGSTNRLRRVAAHELLHALGFTSSVFKARGMFATVPSLRGKRNVPVLNSSSVRAAAKAKYGISDEEVFYGAELEDQGAPGTSLSHWKRRAAKDELMAPVLSLARYSSLSLAALEDMGFYKVDFSKAEPVALGATAGGKLFTEPCLTEGTSNTPTVFCDSLSPSVRSCTADRLSIGRCALTTYSSSLPSYAQYFPNQPTLGGSLSHSDYCPVIQPLSNTGCSGGSLGAMPGSITGDNARCFDADNLLVKFTFTQPGAICAKVHCKSASRTYEVLVIGANSWLSCGAGGTGVTVQPAVSSPNVFVEGGLIACPPYDDVCYANPVAFAEVEAAPTTSTTASPSAATAATHGMVVSGLVAVAVLLGSGIC